MSHDTPWLNLRRSSPPPSLSIVPNGHIQKVSLRVYKMPLRVFFLSLFKRLQCLKIQSLKPPLSKQAPPVVARTLNALRLLLLKKIALRQTTRNQLRVSHDSQFFICGQCTTSNSTSSFSTSPTKPGVIISETLTPSNLITRSYHGTLNPKS